MPKLTSFAWGPGEDVGFARAGDDLWRVDARSGAAARDTSIGDLAMASTTTFATGLALGRSGDSGVVVTALSTGEQRALHEGPPDDYAFAGGTELVGVSARGRVWLWLPESNRRASFAAAPGRSAFAFSPDASLIAIRKPRGGYPRGVDLVDTNTWAPRGTPLMNTRCDDAATLAWSADSSRIAVGSAASFVCIWDVGRAPRLLHEFDLPVVRPPQGPAPPARWLAFTANGAGLVGGADTSDPTFAQADLYRVADAQRLSSLGLRAPPMALPDGAMLLFGKDAPPMLVLSDLRVQTLPLRVGDGPASPDGTAILGVRDGTVRVLDLRTGAVSATLEQSSGSASAAASSRPAFSPTGRFVGSVADGVLSLWDASTGSLGPGVCADAQSR
jgi:WD40 repeat protein